MPIRLTHTTPDELTITNSVVPTTDPSDTVSGVRRAGMRLKNTHQYRAMLACATPMSTQASTDVPKGRPPNRRFAHVFATVTKASSDPSVNRRLRCTNTQSAFHAESA